VQHLIRCEHDWWYNFHLPQVQIALLMLMVSYTSLVISVVKGVLDWNIAPSRYNRDIKCDLKVAASTCISVRTFGGHNTSWLKNSSTLSLCSTKYLLHMKNIICIIVETCNPLTIFKTLLITYDKFTVILL